MSRTEAKKMIKIHIFHTGSVKVDQAIPYKERNPLAVTGFLRGEDKKMVLPVSCYLIEINNRRVLIDTGWHSKYEHEKPRRFFGLLNDISAPILKKGESVDCQLANLGFKPSDIDFLFLSHLDFDHASGLELMKDAKSILSSKEEIDDANKYFFRYVKSTWENVNLKPFYYEQTGIEPVGKSYDVFGDGALVLVNTPGHTHGLFSAVIKHDEKYVVLASDTVYTSRSWKEKIIPGFTVDTQLAKKSLDWICDCVKDKNCVEMIANHDPEIEPHIIEI